MSDIKDLLTAQYRKMYSAMINKDGNALDALLDDSFVLVHMTGMRQDKQAFIKAVQNGTLNYFSEELRESSASIENDLAKFTGKSIVNAAVFGGGRHTWHLQLDMSFRFIDGRWLATQAEASTW